MQKNFSTFLSFAHFLCDYAREELTKNFMSKEIKFSNKKVLDKRELVTDIDLKIEKNIRRLISKNYPHHSIVGEEEEKKIAHSDFITESR